MRYRDFIEELRKYVSEARRLREAGATHNDADFRKWRFGTESIVREAGAHGYRLPGEYTSTARYYADPRDQSQAAMVRALSKDLADSEIQLQFLIDQYDKYGEPPFISSAANVSLPPSPRERLTFSEHVKQHWLIALVLICSGVAGATWKVAHELLVEPREQRFEQMQDEILRLRNDADKSSTNPVSQVGNKAESLSIRSGEVGTTSDGRCAVRVDAVESVAVSLTVTIDDQKGEVIERRQIGDRIVLNASDRTYFIDIQRTRGTIVDIVVAFTIK